jgi:hypothetical protein
MADASGTRSRYFRILLHRSRHLGDRNELLILNQVCPETSPSRLGDGDAYAPFKLRMGDEVEIGCVGPPARSPSQHRRSGSRTRTQGDCDAEDLLPEAGGESDGDSPNTRAIAGQTRGAGLPPLDAAAAPSAPSKAGTLLRTAQNIDTGCSRRERQERGSVVKREHPEPRRQRQRASNEGVRPTPTPSTSHAAARPVPGPAERPAAGARQPRTSLSRSRSNTGTGLRKPLTGMSPSGSTSTRSSTAA